jgi:hypothetical protein
MLLKEGKAGNCFLPLTAKECRQSVRTSSLKMEGSRLNEKICYLQVCKRRKCEIYLV